MGTGTMEKRHFTKKDVIRNLDCDVGDVSCAVFCYTGYIVTYYRDRDAEESRKLANSYAEKLDGDLESMFRNVELIYSEDVNYDKLSHGGLTEFDSYGTLYLLKIRWQTMRIPHHGWGRCIILILTMKFSGLPGTRDPFQEAGTCYCGRQRSF